MLHGIDVAIVLAYVAYSIFWGLRGARRAGASLEEYFLAGRSLRGWQAGISMAATQFAADTPLVVIGLVATAGVFSLWRLWIYALAFLLMALVLGASWRRSGVLTDAELSEARYGGKPAAALRVFKALYFGLVFNCVVLAMVLLATTRIVEPFLVWDQWLPTGLYDVFRSVVEWAGMPLTASGAPCGADGVCTVGSCLKQRCIGPAQWTASTNNALSIGAIVLLTTLYSTTGGLRAVVKTDLAQFTIAMLATLGYAAVVVHAVGGLSELPKRLTQAYPADGSAPGGLTATEVLSFTPDGAQGATWAVMGVVLIQWLCQINADGSGYLAQRTMACRSDRDAQTAGVVFAIAQVLLRSLLWLPIALSLLLLYPAPSALSGSALAAEREATFVRGMAEMLPPGVLGLMLTGMLGALASTLDTHLNWGASYFTNDIYRRFYARHISRREPSARRLVWVARVSTAFILLAALVILPRLDSIQTAWQASLLLGAGVGVLLVLRWLWWRMNATGELVALAVSVVAAPLLLSYVEHDANRLLLMAGLATGGGVLGALATPAEERKRLRKFYERARPPGFWGPIAGAGARQDRRRLLLRLGATLGSGFSIFAILTGLGTWLVGSPAPAFFPWRGSWIAVNLVAGLATVPIWLRWVRRSPALDAAPQGDNPS